MTSMGKMLQRAVRASLFDRRAYTEAFFDDDAAADGALLYAGTAAVVYMGRLAVNGVLGSFDVRFLLQVVLAFLMGWLILAMATWFVATRLFGASMRRPQMMIAMHGLAPLPLLLEIGGSVVGGIGLVWHLAVVTMATREGTSLDLQRSVVSVLIGFALAALVRALFRIPFAVFGF